jgi:hypothetical protein
MLKSGRISFGAMEAVTFGQPAAETVADEARRRDAARVFLMVSGTLNRISSRTPARLECAHRAAVTRLEQPGQLPQHLHRIQFAVLQDPDRSAFEPSDRRRASWDRMFASLACSASPLRKCLGEIEAASVRVF